MLNIGVASASRLRDFGEVSLRAMQPVLAESDTVDVTKGGRRKLSKRRLVAHKSIRLRGVAIIGRRALGGEVDVVLAFGAETAPDGQVFVLVITRARLRSIPPRVEIAGGLHAHAVEVGETLFKHVQVEAHHLAMRLPPLEIHQDLLFHVVPAPHARVEAHQRDGLVTDELPGQSGLRTDLAGAIQTCHGDEVDLVLARALRSGHLGSLDAVPIRGVHDDFHAL
mmetsp:Transcript_61791/g.157063  ORF Transcript_61791/g.157063 Transcript_61791/m.157063 type:complete len:224 (+) Transcript_61791:50-721(+)